MDRKQSAAIEYNIAAIRKLILDAFSAEDLARFCLDHPSLRDVGDEFAPRDGLTHMVQKLLTFCRIRCLWQELLEAIAHARPNRRREVEAILNSPEAPAAARPSVNIGQGLEALSILMQSLEARDAVMAFRRDFRAARDQVGLLIQYKYVHDLLHELQFHCYTPIVLAARRFSEDDLAVEDLEYYNITFQRIIKDLEAAAEQESFPTSEMQWLEDLTLAQAALHAAIAGLDPDELKTAIWHMNRVLAVQPSRINTQLHAAAQVIRLPALVEAITQVCGNLAELELDPAKLQEFQSGMNTLKVLLHDLTDCVNTHDQWQVVDLELRRIEASTAPDNTTELEMSWPYLKRSAEPLYGKSADDWAQSLREDAECLDCALAERSVAAIRRSFQRYRRRAGAHFFRVDLNVKELCLELNKVGEPLATVMRMLE